jgi:GntR family transcriptional repressor for pyruvate dehydrogenase complex
MEPIQARSTHDLVVDRLRRAIHLGTYLPGDRLPPERELAMQFGVSRVTVREALSLLQGEGFLFVQESRWRNPG